MRTIAKIGLAAVLVTGCVRQPVRPPATAAANVASTAPRPATPRREFTAGVQIASLGPVVLTAAGAPAIALHHVRLALTNPGGRGPWRFDPGTAQIDLRQDGTARALFANADVATLPIVMVDPDARIVVDLYFPITGADPAREFVLAMQIASPDRRLSWHRRFDVTRSKADRILARDATPAGSAAYWWLDPRQPWPTFHHGPGLATSRVPDGVIVTSAPDRRAGRDD